MNRRSFIIIAIAMTCATWGYGLISGKGLIESKALAAASSEDDGPVASVKVAPAKVRAIREEIEVYGTIVPAPGAVKVISVPFESRVRNIMVSVGQRVTRGEVLAGIEPSPDTSLKLEEARNAFMAAEEGLKQMRRRFELKLATNDQLLRSRQAFEEARLRIESMKKRGVDGKREIKADIAGFINKVNVQEGAIVKAGDPLVEVVAKDRLEAVLGAEPEEIGNVRAGGSVALFHVNAGTRAETTGRIRKVSKAVNPSTRLVDVFVALPSSRAFLLGEYVRGRITTARAHGLVVPRSAVLPEGDRNVVFTVRDGRAVKHTVKIGLQNGKEVQIIGSDIRPGDKVVVLGNYELKDGMAVKVEPAG